MTHATAAAKLKLKFELVKNGLFLDGSPRIENLSQEFEVVGAIDDWEPEWRKNGAGGYEHYEICGRRQYVPLLFIREVGGINVVAFSLNGRFVWDFRVPAIVPQEWGRPGSRFRLRKDHQVVWM